jgi:hypothetical protein
MIIKDNFGFVTINYLFYNLNLTEYGKGNIFHFPPKR